MPGAFVEKRMPGQLLSRKAETITVHPPALEAGVIAKTDGTSGFL